MPVEQRVAMSPVLGHDVGVDRVLGLQGSPHTRTLLWRGTMTAHSLVICQDDGAQRAPVGFDSEHWKDCATTRLPSTLCVQERLAAGAAGVLLNRSHPFPTSSFRSARRKRRCSMRSTGAGQSKRSRM